MAEVVMNSIGVGTWESSVESVGINGRLVTFGWRFNWPDVKLNVQDLIQKTNKINRIYWWHRKELQDLLLLPVRRT